MITLILAHQWEQMDEALSQSRQAMHVLTIEQLAMD